MSWLLSWLQLSVHYFTTFPRLIKCWQIPLKVPVKYSEPVYSQRKKRAAISVHTTSTPPRMATSVR
jgi:hypothetical protein